jgi:hypothetical protein
MKNYRLIAIQIFFFFIFISCTNEKKIQIIGFAYNNDDIRVLENGKNIFDLQINNNNNNNANKLCTSIDTIFYTKSSNDKLNILIDSSGISVLDTCIIIPRKFKKPSIFFVCPSVKSKFKRIIFSDDESKYVIY